MMKFILASLTLASVVTAYNNQNRLIRVWDNLEIFNSSLDSVGTFNMTSFPYIEGVSA